MTRKPDPRGHADLVRYLLDDLSDEECSLLEERLLADADLQEDLEVAEQEVADRFVKRELPPEQQILVERKFAASKEWQRKFDLASAMADLEVDLDAAHTGSRKSWFARFRISRFQLSVGAAALAFAVAAVWFILSPDTRGPLSRRRFPPVIASFVLAPAASKDGSSQADNVVILPPQPGPIELRLALERDVYSSYEVQLQPLEGGQKVSLGNAVPTGAGGEKREIRVSVDSGRLQPGRFTIVLEANEADGSRTEAAGFSFRVVASGLR